MSLGVSVCAMVRKNSFHCYISKIFTNVVKQNSGKTYFNVQPAMLSCLRHASTTPPTDLGTEIYTGPLAKRICGVKRFSLCTSFGGLLMQPLLIEKMIQEESNLVVAVCFGIIVQFFTFCTPVLLHYVTKKYVKTIYFNPETDVYTAVTYDFLTADKLTQFTVDDVEVPDIPGLFTSIFAKGTPLFIEASFFTDVNHYKRIMGFDKPIDFKLEDKPPKP